MATRKADVAAGVWSDREIQAEGTLEEVGLAAPKARDEMSREAFDAAMAIGLAQARAGLSAPVDEVFARQTAALSDG